MEKENEVNKNEKRNNWYKKFVKELSESKYHFKELTEKDIDNIEFEDIAFYMEAEPGAMGEMGGVEFVLLNKQFYHSNTVEQYEVIKKFFEKFPQIKDIGMALGYASNIPKMFAFFNLGMGNYLFVKDKYLNKFNKKVKTLKHPKYLYMTWKDFALEILK